jgi:hypothetical protein
LIKPNIIDVFALAANLDIVIHSKTYSIYGCFLLTLRADNLTLFRAIHFYFLDLHTQQIPGSEACLSNYPVILAHRTGVRLLLQESRTRATSIPWPLVVRLSRNDPFSTGSGQALPGGTRGTACEGYRQFAHVEDCATTGANCQRKSSTEKPGAPRAGGIPVSSRQRS